MNRHFDIIIIGTGAGGGTLLSRLAPSGKKILVLERGEWLPREKENWNAVAVVQEERYHTDEVWRDKHGDELRPSTGYWVGGNTKVYGGALFRFRERDFETVQHKGGISPEWPVKYADFEPYYTQAERLYQVRGAAGADPTEPPRSAPYAYPAVSHEPRLQEIHHALEARGLRPFHVPLGVRMDEANRIGSPCIRCNTCDGFPCLVDAKSDADVLCVRPALANPNVRIVTGAEVRRILTTPSGKEVAGVEVIVRGERYEVTADVVVLSAGAINSAVVLLRSHSDRHPNGLANRSGQVGRNFMKHHNAALLAVGTKVNPTVFQKTLAVNDFYWGDDEFPYPMGHVSLVGKMTKDILVAGAPFFAPGVALENIAAHSVDWWLTSEDLPSPDNRVLLDGESIVLQYTDENTDGFDRLLARWQTILRSIDEGTRFLPNTLYLKRKLPLQNVGHQCGTARFGRDPATSVLDEDCQAHDVRNLYVVDSSFFPSSSAVNPSLTIMANALRVGDHLLERFQARAA
jgi:choline dehydrogenase-like flavoprotein